MRNIFTELLNEVKGPNLIQNEEAIKIIADIIRFVLTLFVHDEFSDARLFNSILDSSQLIYYKENQRKKQLSSYLSDHGIW